VDFGLAKSTRTADAGLTQTGQVLGTPAYMAPEQASGLVQRIGPAADVYALGGILYEMLVGKPPFLSNDPVQTLMMVLSTDPVLPRELNRHVPRDLQTICLKCLEKKASRRYASALALADDLRNWLENRPIQSRPVGWYVRVGKWIRRNPWQTAAAILLTTLAISSLVATWSLDAAYRETQHANQLLGESNRDLEQANHQANQAFELSRTTLDKVITELGYRLEDLPQAEALFESTQRDTANMYQRLLQLRPDDPLVLRATIMSLENVRTLDWLRGDQAAEVERARQSHELVQRGRSLFPLDDWFAARELQMDIDQFQSLPAADPNRAAREAELLDRLQALETAFPDSASVALANYDWQDALFAAAAAAGNLAEARQALSKRVNWARRHLDLDSTRDPSAPLRLVQALYTAASIELATGEDSQCQKSLREAQQILDEVEPQFRNREHRRLLADIQRLQGSAASRGLDPTSAITCFRSAIGWLEPLVADFPGELSYQVNLAQTRFELASVLMATGQLPLAVQELESARAVTSRVLEAQPEHFAALSLRQQLERAFATLPEAHQ
jgi:tetratricopeptide (TPR) repeat protein